MILAAGLGTRLRPLTDLRAKPALPERGRPVISLLLDLLDRHGCREVMINLHHRSETIRAAVGSDHPADLEISWSEESVPLGLKSRDPGTRGRAGLRPKKHHDSRPTLDLAGDLKLKHPVQLVRRAEERGDTKVQHRRESALNAPLDFVNNTAAARQTGTVPTKRNSVISFGFIRTSENLNRLIR